MPSADPRLKENNPPLSPYNVAHYFLQHGSDFRERKDSFSFKQSRYERKTRTKLSCLQTTSYLDDGLKYRESEEACQETVIVFPSHT